MKQITTAQAAIDILSMLSGKKYQAKAAIKIPIIVPAHKSGEVNNISMMISNKCIYYFLKPNAQLRGCNPVVKLNYCSD